MLIWKIAFVFVGYLDEVGRTEPVPVQYSQGSTAEIPDRIPPLIATNLDTSPHTGQGHHQQHQHHQHHQHRTTAGVTTFSALLVEDMGKLGLHVPEQRKTKTEAGAESPQASRGPAEPGPASAHLRGESGVMQSYGVRVLLVSP